MIEDIVRITCLAGDSILEIYRRPYSVDIKDDKSPLTEADLAAHTLIVDSLAKLTPEIPIVSEEMTEEEKANNQGERFWLVDPLDGTKEFIKKTGEFTVNIALIEDGIPILGVVHTPAIQLTYWAEKGKGAFKKEGSNDPVAINCRKAQSDKLSVVASRDHAGPLVKSLLSTYPSAESSSMGSSLKFCMIAEGKADIYLRDVPTMEWDTAAAHCIVTESGGSITQLNQSPLIYNKPGLKNISIVTIGDRDFPWQIPTPG
ncbi:3'(2'),5'-bisphosphate nucleotidase CysQ [bacterium]|nr:3'(2'),5'-bisphosphate nucleotidase CysQ [bacterium]